MEEGDLFPEHPQPLRCLKARPLVKCIAACDIFYAVLLIGLHLLTLITHGAKAKQRHAGIPTTNAQRNDSSTSPHPLPTTTHKPRETAVVMIWVAMFAICILQLLVAGALYGGTKEREGRVCMRNCRIWVVTSILLILLLLLQIGAIFIQGQAKEHLFRISVCVTELAARLGGIAAIHLLKKELQEEGGDVDFGHDAVYYELQPTTPSSLRRQEKYPDSCANGRTYHRTDSLDDFDFGQL